MDRGRIYGQMNQPGPYGQIPPRTWPAPNPLAPTAIIVPPHYAPGLYWQYYHYQTVTATATTFFAVGGAMGNTTTNLPQQNVFPDRTLIGAISLVPWAEIFGSGTAQLADAKLLYEVGSNVVVDVSGAPVYTQLTAYCTSGTGLIVNFSLATAAAQQFVNIGHPSPREIMWLRDPIAVNAATSFDVKLNLITAPTNLNVAVVLHTIRQVPKGYTAM